MNVDPRTSPPAPIPADEQARIAKLADLELLDTPAERPFDDIVELAATICSAPIALISFIDAERQWFKAKHGLDVDETPRSVSFCAHAINDDDVLVVTDARSDARFHQNPLVVGPPHIRHYVGVPLRVGDGSGLGALCVVDTEPRQPTPTAIAALKTLARQVEQMLAARLAARQRDAAIDRATRLEQRYRTVTETLVHGVVIHDRSGAIEAANPAAQEILGLSIDQMRGLTPMDPRWICTRDDGSPFPGEEHPASLTLRDGIEVRDVVMGVLRREHDLRWLSVTSTPLLSTDGTADGAVATFVDITLERLLQQRLQRSLEVVSQTLRENAALTSAITHELAAPVAANRIYADLLSSPERSMGEHHGVVERLQASAHKVENLVADLGAVTRRVGGPATPPRAHVDVRSAITRAAAATQARIDLRLPSNELLAYVDELQVERIVDNLISNATRHGAGGTGVRITVEADDTELRIVVDDAGAGVAEADRERIFEPFERGEGAASTGTGLGLFLVRQFAEFHHGTAVCEASPLGGARFVVTLARHPDRADPVGSAPSGAPSPPPPAGSGRRAGASPA